MRLTLSSCFVPSRFPHFSQTRMSAVVTGASIACMSGRLTPLAGNSSRPSWNPDPELPYPAMR